ncbi:MAG: citramalate synthase [Nitrospinota bacterium]|nr:citramalate synthase [Nitrospinota bacterium]
MAAKEKVFLYDTTLRDGAQAEEVSFSLDDKLRIAEALDDFGIHYIEGGWPGSNPRDKEFFQQAGKLKLKTARISAFGSTHHPKNKPAQDNNVKLLLEARTPCVTVVGKSWDSQARVVLGISPERNLELIHDTIAYLATRVDEVMFDAEHFFDGYKANPEYAMKALEAAHQAGASWQVLCETNGGALPQDVARITAEVARKLPAAKYGIHCHNDSETAVANTLAAVEHGVRQTQGTINGIGERCGNANLCSIIPNLQLKLGYKAVAPAKMKKLLELSHLVYELANMSLRPHQPFVGRSAFAHKGGIHVAAVSRDPSTYEHVQPESVGNRRRVLISDLSGKSNVLWKASEFGIELDPKDPATVTVLEQLKNMEAGGFLFEGAEASFELLIRKATGRWKKKFEVVRARVVSNFSDIHGDNWAEAVIKLKMPDGAVTHAVAEGNGPVNALDKAVRMALRQQYPEIAHVELHDFKVRLLDESSKTAAMTRVLIESGDGERRWGTVGVSSNIIEASWRALVDSLEYKLHLPKTRAGKKPKGSGGGK